MSIIIGQPGGSGRTTTPTDDPANPNDARPDSAVISADTTINALSALRLWVDTSAADVTLTLAMADNQMIAVHNTGDHQVIFNTGSAVFANGSTMAYLTANGDYVEIIKSPTEYFAG